MTSFTSLTVLKDCLYATAGGPSSLGQTYKCNPEENFWEVLEGQPQYDRRGSCVVADDKHLYIIGGSIVLFTALILVVRFDPVESKWEQISPMNEERLYAFGVARNGRIYAQVDKKDIELLTLVRIQMSGISCPVSKYHAGLQAWCALRLLQTFAGVFGEKIRMRAILKENTANYMLWKA